jgi:molecular chaperone GrpE
MMAASKKDEVREEAKAEEEAQKAEAEAVDASAETEEQAGEEATTSADDLAKAQEEAGAWKDKYYRLHAEWDTYRRRMNEQRAEEKLRATEKLIEELVPVLDDFERTIDYAEKNGETGLLGGVTAVHQKLKAVFEKEGVEVIDPKGEAFNALEAQAVATVDDPSVPDETVAEVYQKGYRMGNKVIRNAMVTVTVGGPKREPEPEEDED